MLSERCQTPSASPAPGIILIFLILFIGPCYFSCLFCYKSGVVCCVLHKWQIITFATITSSDWLVTWQRLVCAKGGGMRERESVNTWPHLWRRSQGIFLWFMNLAEAGLVTKLTSSPWPRCECVTHNTRDPLEETTHDTHDTPGPISHSSEPP